MQHRAHISHAQDVAMLHFCGLHEKSSALSMTVIGAIGPYTLIDVERTLMFFSAFPSPRGYVEK